MLTPGQDAGAAFVGGSFSDTFSANVVQNSLGAQVNTLGSGDMLNGAGGSNDTLAAKITSGVFAGGSSTAVAAGSESMPIQPETTSIENIKLQAVNSGIYASKESSKNNLNN